MDGSGIFGDLLYDAQQDFHQLVSIVKTESIDEFGHLPGIPLMTGLTYHGRPMPIRFVALGEYLQNANAKFYRYNNTAPDFVYANIDSIDNRFSPQDDSLAQLELLSRYDIIALDRGRVIYHRRPTQNQHNIAFNFIERRQIFFDSTILIPHTTTGYLWACVDINTTIFGHLIKFIYKLPDVWISVIDNSHSPVRSIRNFKFIPVDGGT